MSGPFIILIPLWGYVRVHFNIIERETQAKFEALESMQFCVLNFSLFLKEEVD